MKHFVFILFIGLISFTGFANSYSESHTSYIHIELNKERAALWAEMAFKESILSAISTMEKINETLGLNNYDSPKKQIIAVPIIMGSLAATFAVTKIAKRPLQKLPSGEELKAFKSEYRFLKYNINTFEDTIKFYQKEIESHPLHRSDFAEEIDKLPNEELIEKKYELATIKENLENNLETKNESEKKKMRKEINQIKAQQHYITLNESELDSMSKLTRDQTYLNTLIKNEKPKLSYKAGLTIRQAGTGAIFLAGIGAYIFIAGDALYITLKDEEVFQIKKQYQEDVERIRQILLQP